jgi:competence protein ComEA
MDGPTDDDAAAPVVHTVLRPRALVIAAGVIALIALAVVLLGARAPAVVPVGGGDRGDDGRASVDGAVPVGSGSESAVASGAATARTGGTADPASSVPVVVDVAGAVARSGVVRLASGSRVQDAVDAAGGLVEGADTGRVNLARMLVDGEQVYVPRVGEEPPQVLGPGVAGASGAGAGTAAGGGAGAGAGAEAGVVDLNTADQATLETLPGIGPALAGRIIAWRTEHGRFTSPEDLLDVSGIGDARFADLEPRVRV